jgi:sulfofructose kinase
MNTDSASIDVLCVGHACYDLIFQVNHHPQADEKIFAEQHHACGGGPAANAAVAVSRLGFKAAFAGYLGNDLYGDQHRIEFTEEQVDTQLLIRGNNPTPVSVVLVKPDGKRALVNYKVDTLPLPKQSLDFSQLQCKTVLFDGHEAEISLELAEFCQKNAIPMVLDAGSVHPGTLALMDKVDYLICSEKFAHHFAETAEQALNILAKHAPVVVITQGEQGLIWKNNVQEGYLPAFPVKAIDTTGAGDAFHGAFAAAITDNKPLIESLRYASAVAALCCTKIGARTGLPHRNEVNAFLKNQE